MGASKRPHNSNGCFEAPIRSSYQPDFVKLQAGRSASRILRGPPPPCVLRGRSWQA
jgi:hypothetical protein